MTMTIKTHKLSSGFYEITGTKKPLYLSKDTGHRRKWGQGDSWDLIYPDKEDTHLPIEKRSMSFLISAETKTECLHRLSVLMEHI